MTKQGLIIESNKDYHGYKEAISKSRLAKMEKCPAYFKWCEDNPQEPTSDMILGSAFHKIVLEPKEFSKEFVVAESISTQSHESCDSAINFYHRELKLKNVLECVNITEKREYIKELQLQLAKKKQTITQEQYDMICSMRDSVLNNKYAKVLLQGNIENSMYAVDDLTQEPIKARPDCYKIVQDRVLITDLKSCRSAIESDLVRDVAKYGYDLQSYMYTEIASKVLEVPKENIDFVFIFVEKTAPYLVNVMQADTYVLQRGEQLFRKYIGQYHECKESNNWYGLNGAYDIINNLSLPQYLMNINE